jgi:hypothetical protein
MGLKRARKPFRCCGILLGLVMLGCGREDKLTPVHGHVFYHGQPLAGGTIVFTPDPERGGRGPLACGEIAADGRYVLQSEQKPGATPGWHRVTIAPPSSQPGEPASPAPTIDLPRKYSDPDQSGLVREIKADKVVEQDFHLE